MLTLEEITQKYTSTSCGRIYRNGKELKLHPTKKGGHLMFQACIDGKVHGVLVHRLVYHQHNGNIPTGLVVDHVDECKTNNLASNLQLLTNKQNLQKSGKLSVEIANHIRDQVKLGVPRKFFQDKYGISKPMVADIIHLRTYTE